MKVMLRYTDCLQDGRNVFRVLAENNIDILKTKRHSCSVEVEVVILVDNKQELNKLLYKLNCACLYEVSVVKISEGKKPLPFSRNKKQMSKSDIEVKKQ